MAMILKQLFSGNGRGRASEVGGDGAARWGSKVGIVMIFSIHGSYNDSLKDISQAPLNYLI